MYLQGHRLPCTQQDDVHKNRKKRMKEGSNEGTKEQTNKGTKERKKRDCHGDDANYSLREKIILF